VAALFLGLLLGAAAESPALALDLFATRHEVTAQFATADGKPMANAAVEVFAPDNPRTPVEKGRTNSDGKYVFAADRAGMWSAEARTKSEVARVTIRVGGAGEDHRPSRIPPVVVILGLIALLALALWYRVLRRRNERHRP
jgi:nickel transport protein